MTKTKTGRLSADAMLAAMCAVLGYLSLDFGNLKITFESVPVLVAALLFVLTTGFAVGERRSLLDRSEAVVMSSSAAVKSAPDKAATDLFVLHEGTSVRITGELDRWCEITIADGKKGWIERSKIEAV